MTKTLDTRERIEGSSSDFFKKEFEDEPSKSSARPTGRANSRILITMPTLYRTEHRTNETITVDEIVSMRKKNAHGAVVYLEGEPGKGRLRMYLDLPTRELVDIEEFKKLKAARALANFQKFQGRKVSLKRRDCRSFAERREDFFGERGLSPT